MSRLSDAFGRLWNALSRTPKVVLDRVIQSPSQSAADKLSNPALVLHKVGEVYLNPIGRPAEGENTRDTKVTITLDLHPNAEMAAPLIAEMSGLSVAETFTESTALLECAVNTVMKGHVFGSLTDENGNRIIAAINPDDGSYIHIRSKGLDYAAKVSRGDDGPSAIEPALA